jgi:cell division protein FtsA
MRSSNGFIVAVDIGTSKVCAVVGRRTGDGVDVVGFGTHESRGLRKGQVVELEATADSLRAALDEAELMAGIEARSIYVGISSGKQRGRLAESTLRLSAGMVHPGDVERALDLARRQVERAGQEILHTLPVEFGVDEQSGLRRPVGLSGQWLHARAHVVSTSTTTVQNLTRCADRSGVHVDGMVMETLACSFSALDRQERERGVVLVDIGGGTTDIAVWHGGAIVHSAVIPFGGDNVTKDIAIGLSTSWDAAARLKERHGCALTERADTRSNITVPGLMGRPAQTMSAALLATIIEPRFDEILRLVRREVDLCGYGDVLEDGYVLTGGSVVMPGCIELARRALGARVRVGVPVGVGGLLDVVRQPRYAAAVGLLNFVANNRDPSLFYRAPQRSIGARLRSGLKGFIDRIL